MRPTMLQSWLQFQAAESARLGQYLCQTYDAEAILRFVILVLQDSMLDDLRCFFQLYICKRL